MGRLYPYLLLLPLLSVMACDEIEEAIEQEIDITTQFVIDLPVGVDEMGNPDLPVKFYQNGAFDVLAHPDVAERIGTPEQIKKVAINTVIYEFKNFSGNTDAVVNGQFGFIAVSGEFKYFPAEAVNVAEADLFENTYILAGNFDEISEAVSNSKAFVCTYFGTSSKNPAYFIVTLTIHATITVVLNADDL